MTPEQEAAILDAVGVEIDAEMARAFAQYRALVLAGTPPRDAVAQAMESFKGEFAQTMAEAFTAILGASIGAVSVLQMKIGTVTLSQALYADADEIATIVQGIVQRHAAGFTDARRLALDLYEGYGFRPIEALKFSKSNDRLPQYLRDALLPELEGDLARIFARMTVDNLSTPALKAAYSAVLNGIGVLENSAGAELLDKRLRVAFEEKARYLANRIAQTELHRAFAERQAKELMDDKDVQYVQWRMSMTHPREDICDYFAGVNLYGLGAGVYPKAVAPVPTAHPFCRCVLAPRLDLTGRTAKEADGAEQAFFATLDPQEAARIAGSRAKLQAILDGADPLDVHNAGKPQAYQMQSVADASAQYEARP